MGCRLPNLKGGSRYDPNLKWTGGCMLIFAIDDEPDMCDMLQKSIQEADPRAEVRSFPDGLDALEAIEKHGLRPSVIFSDIIMPKLDGLKLAVRLKAADPDVRLVFVTRFAGYALEAYQLHVSGYILKPPKAERIREELRELERRQKACDQPEERLQARCFGHFEVFWRGKPLPFGRQQTKELLAFLIDCRGSYCSSEEIIAGMWEDVQDLKAAKHRLRNLVSDLRNTLREIGMEELLLHRRNQLAIVADLVDCDYYRMLDGNLEAINAFRGEYMAQYSWAEMTKGDLFFRVAQPIE